jgi:hypothetical protein
MHTNSNGWEDSMLMSAAFSLVGFFLRMHLLLAVGNLRFDIASHTIPYKVIIDE